MTTFSKIFGKSFYEASIEIRYEYFKTYIKSISKNFEDELSEYEIKIEAQKKKEGVLPVLLPSFIHGINKMSIPKYFYNSTFTFIYSMLEDYLKTICESYQKVNKMKLSVSDLEGRGYIGKSRKYLEKCCNLDMASLNTEWEKITVYQKVRNAIVHNNSSI